MFSIYKASYCVKIPLLRILFRQPELNALNIVPIKLRSVQFLWDTIRHPENFSNGAGLVAGEKASRKTSIISWKFTALYDCARRCSTPWEPGQEKVVRLISRFITGHCPGEVGEVARPSSASFTRSDEDVRERYKKKEIMRLHNPKQKNRPNS